MVQCSQNILNCLEEVEQLKQDNVESEQQQSVDVLKSSASETVSCLHSTQSTHAAVNPKYVQLLGDKAAVSLNILMFPIANYLLIQRSSFRECQEVGEKFGIFLMIRGNYAIM